MTKNLGLSLFLTLTLVLGLTTGVLASTNWHLTWNEDSTIGEKVLTDDQELATLLSSWGFSAGTEAGSFYRATKDWDTFNNLAGKLPLTVTTKNLMLFQNTTFSLDDTTSQLSNLDKQKYVLQITVPGFYYKNSGEKIADLTSQWNIYPGFEQTLKKPYLTKSIILNGFLLGVIIALIGLISIAIVFMKSINRVNKLIEEEYSIENYLAEQQKVKEVKTDEE